VTDAALWAPDAYDVVFCRNMLMYLTPDGARQVVAHIERALAPGGYVFVGHAEVLRGLSEELRLCNTHGTFYYRRPDPAADPPALARAPETDSRRRPAETGRPTPPSTPRVAARAPDGISAPAGASDLSPALDLLAQERYGEALERVSALLPPAGRQADAQLLRAILLTHAGRFDEAEEACARVLEIDPLNAGAHYALALCRERAGDRQGAIDHDRAAVYLDGSFAMPRLHLGLLARKEGARETARRELGQALVLLEREEPSRVLLFGGGFRREALSEMCRIELEACGGRA
jgi:chemotaxis protein methyltransferase CheR